MIRKPVGFGAGLFMLRVRAHEIDRMACLLGADAMAYISRAAEAEAAGRPLATERRRAVGENSGPHDVLPQGRVDNVPGASGTLGVNLGARRGPLRPQKGQVGPPERLQKGSRKGALQERSSCADRADAGPSWRP